MKVQAATSFELDLNVGENGKVVMSSGIYGNGSNFETDVVNLTFPFNLENKMIIGNGQYVNVNEGASISIQTGGEIIFYPATDNSGTITAIPADGYDFAGWYNGESLYSENASLNYKNISEDLTLIA